MSSRLNGGGAAHAHEHQHAGRGDEPGASELRAQLQLLLRQRLGVAAASCVLGAAGTASLFAAWVASMRPPQLRFAPTAANLALLRSIPLLHRSYVPHILAWNAHLAGYFGYVKLPVYRYLGGGARREEMVQLSDGGSVSLLWATGSKALPLTLTPTPTPTLALTLTLTLALALTLTLTLTLTRQCGPVRGRRACAAAAARHQQRRAHGLPPARAGEV